MDARQAKRILRQNLRTEEIFGVTAVPRRVSDAAEAGAGTQGKATAQAGAAAQTFRPVIGPVDTAASGKEQAPMASNKPSRPGAPPDTTSLFATGAPASAAPGAAASWNVLPREEKVRLLTVMDENEVRACSRCQLCRGRTKTVFGEGDPDAKLLFIGEGPGETEDLQGRPFVGRAGELLDKMIVAMGLERGKVYIANTVKCRPPQNRTPTPAEIEACWPYLRRQILALQPQVIVTLGAPATKTLLRTTTGITALRGQWHWFDGLAPDGPVLPVMPTFHPAYLLRAYTPDNRRKVWDDLQKVMALLTGQTAVPR